MNERDSQPKQMKSYLLRLWREELNGEIEWRVSLTHIPDGQRHGFPDLAAALSFLESQLVIDN